MEKQTSFAYQRKVLSDLGNLLSELDENLALLESNFADKVSSLSESGMMEEIYRDYEANYQGAIRSAIVSLRNRIQTEDMAFVEKEIDFFSLR